MAIIPTATGPVSTFCRSGVGPDFKTCLKGVATWGAPALERAVPGLTCTMAVRIGWGDGVKVHPDTTVTLEPTRVDAAVLAQQRYD